MQFDVVPPSPNASCLYINIIEYCWRTRLMRPPSPIQIHKSFTVYWLSYIVFAQAVFAFPVDQIWLWLGRINEMQNVMHFVARLIQRCSECDTALCRNELCQRSPFPIKLWWENGNGKYLQIFIEKTISMHLHNNTHFQYYLWISSFVIAIVTGFSYSRPCSHLPSYKHTHTYYPNFSVPISNYTSAMRSSMNSIQAFWFRAITAPAFHFTSFQFHNQRALVCCRSAAAAIANDVQYYLIA